MGEATLHRSGLLTIHSIFYFYGDAASAEMSAAVAADISAHWNEPAGKVKIKRQWVDVQFIIEGIYAPLLMPEMVWYNTLPRHNYFRIEEYAASDISFVDGINCNTGYFKLANLLNNSTTAAHEYGHTLGLKHPAMADIRGKGQPGIMYPRGTICDPEYQYDPAAQPLAPGGTMNPFKRKVLQSDIELLNLDRLSFDHAGLAVVGDFSSVFHNRHVLEG